MSIRVDRKRTIGLIGATSIGVGGIVGGGILTLGGVAFANTGPSASLAFALNGLIAIMVALSYAEMSSTFPESGGMYLFSKKVLSIESAFFVGWVVWFASVFAAVLYAIGFASFLVIAVNMIWNEFIGNSPPWLSSLWLVDAIAVAATLFYTIFLSKSTDGGGNFLNVGKMAIFSILILSGLFAFVEASPGQFASTMTPFFSNGVVGLFIAMGYTFVVMQGFDLIPKVGGEIKEPEKNIPRAMLLSLIISLMVYIPLLFVTAVVGVSEGHTITSMGLSYKEGVFAVGVKNYMGNLGYWFVLIVGILSMLSALSANIFGASHVAYKMAIDRTLPKRLGFIHDVYKTPTKSIYVTSIVTILIIITFRNVESAGATASLLFLLVFTVAQLMSMLVRRRIDISSIPFRMPLYPVLPVVGSICCFLLAVFQGFVAPKSGLITLIWLFIGGLLYLILFSKSAKRADASAAAYDLNLSKLRGQMPLVLVPVSNPTNVASLIRLASSLAPPKFGKVMLLSVVTRSDSNDDKTRRVAESQNVTAKSLEVSIEEKIYPEVLTTVADNVWEEIKRVSESCQCDSLVLGLTDLNEKLSRSYIEENLISGVSCNVVVLRSYSDWRLKNIKKVLVPIAGEGNYENLLARLIGTLYRVGSPEIEFLKVIPKFSRESDRKRARNKLFSLAQDYSMSENFKVRVVKSDNVAEEIINQSEGFDLMVLGFTKVDRHYLRVFGAITQEIVQNTDMPIILISHPG